ncbi:DnaJ like chaperone protein [Marinospirillum celere]|uniref:DnaJ like chaperone protein n=1 Tax=Marinospirillum celere TaxID=1122252 RepID=A0A1I1H120_9GAMM|nr:co-chaperone DjlA [Marinospirillum celere]SFC14880.1 DnaJ like chaperone protein [Marinospirillum celere]
MKLRLPPFAGKAAGALIGFLLGGWVGLALGIILGHSFDYHRQSLFVLLGKLPRGRLPKPSERIYRETLFTCLGYLAKQDGRVSPQEIAAAEALFKRMKLKRKERQEAIERFNQGKLASQTTAQNALEQLRKRYATRKARRLDFMEQLLEMAYADGGPREAQLKIIQSFLPFLDIGQVDLDRLHRRIREAKGYGTSQERQQGYTRKPTQELSLVSAYRTLGLNSSASNKEIKLTYRRLMSQNHPDKLMAQGLTDRALAKAKERAQEIQQAYALLKKARGL